MTTERYVDPNNRVALAFRNGKTQEVRRCTECGGLVVEVRKGPPTKWPMGAVKRSLRAPTIYDVEDDGETFTYQTSNRHTHEEKT